MYDATVTIWSSGRGSGHGHGMPKGFVGLEGFRKRASPDSLELAAFLRSSSAELSTVPG